jgi:hypothetical protein
MITGFFILIEVFTFYNIFVGRQNQRRNITFIYTLVLVGTCALFLSFMLGPISTISYIEFLNGQPSPA